MKTIGYISLSMLVFMNSAAFSSAAESQGKKGASIRELIVDLNKEYDALDEKIRAFDESIKSFPSTTLNLSVIKREAGIKLVSIDVVDNGRFVKGHVYAPIEDSALSAGGRHQLYLGEMDLGSHNLKIIYTWSDGGTNVKKGETTISLNVKAARTYLIELAIQKKGKEIEIRPYQLDFSNR
ncbi:MAG: hypothetical protein HY886_03600 [Deltaproteobacteria bacterium]|nr:hypothetical protein [Deltaproteobacteria bacterium]